MLYEDAPVEKTAQNATISYSLGVLANLVARNEEGEQTWMDKSTENEFGLLL